MFTFGQMGLVPMLGDVPAPVGTIPAAPLMTWASTSSDSTPDFDIDLPSGVGDGTDAAAGDVLHIQYQASGGDWSTPSEYVSYTLLAGDIAADTITESGSAVADGDYVFRARLERSGVGNSSWTSDVAVTISTASWSPDTATGALITWTKADADVYSDAGTTPATNGGGVQQWNDQSANAIHFSQSTSAFQFTYNTGVLNGLPGLTSSAASTTFMTSAQTATQPFMLFVLVKTDANIVTNNGYEVLVQDNSTGARAVSWINRNDNGKISSYAGTSTYGAVAAAASTGYYLCFVFDGASSEIWVNGTQYVAGDIGSSAIANSFMLSSTSEPTNSTFIEVFAIAGTNATDKSSGIAYLKSRGGL